MAPPAEGTTSYSSRPLLEGGRGWRSPSIFGPLRVMCGAMLVVLTVAQDSQIKCSEDSPPVCNVRTFKQLQAAMQPGAKVHHIRVMADMQIESPLFPPKSLKTLTVCAFGALLPCSIASFCHTLLMSLTWSGGVRYESVSRLC